MGRQLVGGRGEAHVVLVGAARQLSVAAHPVLLSAVHYARVSPGELSVRGELVVMGLVVAVGVLGVMVMVVMTVVVGMMWVVL